MLLFGGFHSLPIFQYRREMGLHMQNLRERESESFYRGNLVDLQSMADHTIALARQSFDWPNLTAAEFSDASMDMHNLRAALFSDRVDLIHHTATLLNGTYPHMPTSAFINVLGTQTRSYPSFVPSASRS